MRGVNRWLVTKNLVFGGNYFARGDFVQYINHSGKYIEINFNMKIPFMDCWDLVLQLPFVGLPCVPISGYSHLSLSSKTTGCTTPEQALSLAKLWGSIEVMAQNLWTPSHLLHESTMRRD